MNSATAGAYGKVILFGEHAVIYGHPAVAIPVTAVRTNALAEPAGNGRIRIEAPQINESCSSPAAASEPLAPLLRVAEITLRRLHAEDRGLTLTLNSNIPVARGFGSSAAASVAIIRAIASALDEVLDTETVSEIAFEAEKMYHGNPSGIDNAVVAHEKPIFFAKRRGARPLDVGQPFTFVIGDTGVPQSTAEVVADVAAKRDQNRAHYDAIFWEMGTMACVGREILKGGSRAELGDFMNRNHQLLQAIDVSSEDLDRLVEAAHATGAAGAKLSGSGRGGTMVALVDDGGDAGEVGAALREAGAEQIIVTELL